MKKKDPNSETFIYLHICDVSTSTHTWGSANSNKSKMMIFDTVHSHFFFVKLFIAIFIFICDWVRPTLDDDEGWLTSIVNLVEKSAPNSKLSITPLQRMPHPAPIIVCAIKKKPKWKIKLLLVNCALLICNFHQFVLHNLSSLPLSHTPLSTVHCAFNSQSSLGTITRCVCLLFADCNSSCSHIRAFIETQFASFADKLNVNPRTQHAWASSVIGWGSLLNFN